MNFTDISIKRPTFITMLILVIVTLGLAALRGMPLDLLPKMEFPIVAVTAMYPGAAPQEVETMVTKPIEDIVSTVSGIKSVKSYASEGVSTVIVEFNMDTPMRKAAEDVREKIALASRVLPDEVETPIVQTFDPGAQPVVFYGFTGDSNLALSEYAEDVIKPRLQQLAGVGSVAIYGQQLSEVQVRLDAQKLAAYNLPVATVLGTLRATNMDIPGGRLEGAATQEVLRLTGKFRSLAEIENAYIPLPTGGNVQLKEIDTDAAAQQQATTRASINSRKGVVLATTKQSDANTVTVSHSVTAELKKLQKAMPAGYRLNLIMDQAEFIEESISELQETILLGGLLAILVVFFFLRDWRATLISAIAIPVSIIATFALIKALGFSLNMLTMMGLSLSVGLLIDDAIVVIDNIYRHLEMGKPPLQAALEGTREITLAVLAVTLTIVAVFIPVGFAGGLIGKMMSQFAFTVAGAVLVSLVVALTLTPMLASRLLKAPHSHSLASDPATGGNKGWNRLNHGWEVAYQKVEGVYSRLLGWALKHRWKTLGIATVAFVTSLGSMKFIGTEFTPQMDRGMLQVAIKAGAQSSLEGTETIVKQVEARIRQLPEVETVFMTVGNFQSKAANEASIMVRLLPKSERHRSTKQLEDELRPFFQTIPGAKIQFTQPTAVGGAPPPGMGGGPIQIKLMSNDLATLDRLSSDLTKEIAQIPGVVDLGDSLDTGKPELKVVPNRELLAATNTPESSLMGTLRTLVSGDKIGDFSIRGKDREIRMRLREEDRQNLSTVGSLTVTSPTGPLAIGDLATIEQGNGPVLINRDNRTRVVTIGGNIKGRSLGEVNKDITALLEKTPFPQGVTWSMGGEVEQMKESFTGLLIALVLAILFIYMVLAAQFESYIHPFTIMLSLPLAIVGALVSLLITGKTLSIISIIGIITLMGLVTKNAILVVEFTNQLREQGMPMVEALKRAAPIRLRPILMTTFAMILGMLPMALGVGSGAEMRQSMGIAVIGGLITSTLLTLLVVPVVYTMLDRFTLRGRAERKQARKAREEVAPALS